MKKECLYCCCDRCLIIPWQHMWLYYTNRYTTLLVVGMHVVHGHYYTHTHSCVWEHSYKSMCTSSHFYLPHVHLHLCVNTVYVCCIFYEKLGKRSTGIILMQQQFCIMTLLQCLDHFHTMYTTLSVTSGVLSG